MPPLESEAFSAALARLRQRPDHQSVSSKRKPDDSCSIDDSDISFLSKMHKIDPSSSSSSSSSSSTARVRVPLPPSGPRFTLQFFVRLMSRTLVIHARPHDTVDSVVARIQEMTGIPALEQRLIYRGRQLPGDSILAYCDVENDATLQLTGRGSFQNTKHPRTWQLVNDLVSTVCNIASGDDTNDRIDEKERKKERVTSLVKEFLIMADNIEDSGGSEEDTWGHLQVFILAGAPAALVKLYLSPGGHFTGLHAIQLFVDSDPGLIPKLIHLKCTPILLEFSKLLSGTLGKTDPLYTKCRSTLAALLKAPESAYFSRFKSTNVVRELLPFVTEMTEKVLDGLSKEFMPVPSSDLVEFSGFLYALGQAVQNCMGDAGRIPTNMFNGKHSQRDDWMIALHEIFIDLLEKVAHCLKKLESLLGQTASVINKSPLVVDSPIPVVLAECSAFFKIFEGAEELLHSVLLERRSVLNLLLKHANRNENLCWILRHKDLIDTDIRRNLVLFMFPEYEAELHEMLIDRSRLLAESFEYIAQVDATSLHGGLLMEFKDEEATGHGVLREWFCLICKEIFSPQNVLFLSCPSDRRRFLPNHASTVDPMHLKYFVFCGRVIALALMHKVQVGIVFDRVFFLQLAGESVTLEDIQYADPDIYRSCKKILELDADLLDSDALGLTFVREIEELGTLRTIELCPGGKDIVVNSRNRDKYVDFVIQHRFVTSISEQVAHFAQGFSDILTNSNNQKFFFQCLDLEDFNQLLGGIDSVICIMDWKAHTEYNGYRAKDRQIQWFWKIVKGMTVEQQRGLLFFWTSVRYLPVDGFGGLGSKLYIYRSLDSHECLPTSQTCFYRLCLPQYRSESVMRDRLLLITQEHISRAFGLW